MKAGARKGLLFAALAGVVVWSIQLARTPKSVMPLVSVHVQPSHPSVRPALSSASVPVSPMRLAPAMLADLFIQQTWVPPPPPPTPPPPPPPPAPPEAPPLPFIYLGMWQTAGRTTYYLQDGVQLIGAHADQVLDGVWRVHPGASGMPDFDYLPLKQTRRLRMGEPLANSSPVAPR